jgi:hypothetical protein
MCNAEKCQQCGRKSRTTIFCPACPASLCSCKCQDAHLDRFLQAYAAEKTKLEARKQGYTVTEQQLADGSLKLHILEAP